ncbi:hypothetical protein CBR_g18569 [Chara braunii]|uniref:Protein DA1-like domain-containing protein n=1 Tax=Chara braunii TaxID=69332 RepID=A0A388JT50_CHABU|nr:hypothetical protein CBR_g18569 [Chara braunii]|eukprot:GBG60971.1 hypothetical protein CBR_g18569 [Chara braunii]
MQVFVSNGRSRKGDETSMRNYAEFSVANGDPYHTECHKRLFQPKCHVCKNYIPANMYGLIEYRSHPFWSDKYCPSHENDGTPRCCGCERLEARDAQFADLDDGRKLCLECCGTVIVDTNDAQPLITEVLNFYRTMKMPIRQNIPILLVERQALNAAQQGEKDGRHHHPETRGLCLSEEQTIRTVVRRPHSVAAAALGMMGTAYQTVRRHCEVTAILVLYGLPRFNL